MLEKTKNFVKEHKYQIIAGVSVTATGVLSVLLLKEKIGNKALMEENETTKAYYDEVVGTLVEQVKVIHEAMSEGMVQEAIATTTRKLNTRLDIIARFKGNENDEKYIKALKEAEVFKGRLKAFNKLAETYTIED